MVCAAVWECPGRQTKIEYKKTKKVLDKTAVSVYNEPRR